MKILLHIFKVLYHVTLKTSYTRGLLFFLVTFVLLFELIIRSIHIFLPSTYVAFGVLKAKISNIISKLCREGHLMKKDNALFINTPR